jgi:FMN reductase
MKITSLLGSPSAPSRSAALLQLAQSRLRPHASSFSTVVIRELPARALTQAQFDDPDIAQAVRQVTQAQVVLVATPIYKAAYSGLLKAFLDLLPQDALRDKTVLPLATGGSAAHLLALDYALKPVLSALGARDILDAVYASDAQVTRIVGGAGDAGDAFAVHEEISERIDRSLQGLVGRARAWRAEAEAAEERDALLRRARHAAGDAAWATPDVRWAT